MEALWNLEIEITLFFQSLGNWLTAPFQGVSFLATEIFFIIMIPLVYWCVNSLMGVRMAFMLVLSDTFNNFFKMLLHTPRPFWYDTRVKSFSQETAFGLPSGHSQNSASLWGIAAATLKKRWFTITAIVIIILIGLSRIYLGMHFLHDVLGGWLVACGLIFIYLKLEKPVARWIAPKKLGGQILYALFFSAVIATIYMAGQSLSSNFQIPAEWLDNAAKTGGATPNPFNVEGAFTLSGMAFGFISGYAWWVKKYGLPKVKGSWMKRFLRYLVGMVGLIAIYAGLKAVFPAEPLQIGYAFRFLRYALIGLWASAIAPCLFVKLKLDE